VALVSDELLVGAGRWVLYLGGWLGIGAWEGRGESLEDARLLGVTCFLTSLSLGARAAARAF
jgi:hypothetical protein